MLYFRIDYEDITENIQQYDSLEELIRETNYFYHSTFSDEDDYDVNKEFTTLQECIKLWEGNGYLIAQEIRVGE